MKKFLYLVIVINCFLIPYFGWKSFSQKDNLDVPGVPYTKLRGVGGDVTLFIHGKHCPTGYLDLQIPIDRRGPALSPEEDQATSCYLKEK